MIQSVFECSIVCKQCVSVFQSVSKCVLSVFLDRLSVDFHSSSS